MQIDLVGGHADPVLYVVGRLRRCDALVDEQQSRHAILSELDAPGFLTGPPDQDDVHAPTVRERCFALVSRT
jgi:hypothetical protein